MIESTHKLFGGNDECALIPGMIHYLMIRRDDRAGTAELADQSLNHLIRTFATPRIDDLDPSSVFVLFGPTPVLPAIKHDGNGVRLALVVGSEITNELLAPRISPVPLTGPDLPQGAQEVVPVDNQVRRHAV